MLRPWSRALPPRPRCAADGWTVDGWTLLEHHELAVAAPPPEALAALATLPLRELPVVRALFALRGMRFSADQTLRAFFTTPPFVALAEEPGRELVVGIVRARAAGARAAEGSAVAFRDALPTAPFAAVATFRADPADGGAILWTRTWVRTRGAAPGAAFAAYWLAIGPWSAWIRRMFLRAARARAEGAPPAAAG